MVFMEHGDLFRIKYVQILRQDVYYMCTTNSKSFVLCYIIIYKIKIVMLFRYCAFWRTYQLKVKKFQNVFMKSSFLPNYEPKKCKDFFPVVWHNTGQKSLHILGETMTS